MTKESEFPFVGNSGVFRCFVEGHFKTPWHLKKSFYHKVLAFFIYALIEVRLLSMYLWKSPDWEIRDFLWLVRHSDNIVSFLPTLCCLRLWLDPSHLAPQGCAWWWRQWPGGARLGCPCFGNGSCSGPTAGGSPVLSTSPKWWWLSLNREAVKNSFIWESFPKHVN